MRFNPLGIQMLPKTLHQQLFKRKWEATPTQTAVEQSKKHLKDQGISGKKTSTLPDISFTLPQMQGRNLNEHFTTIARQQSQSYLDLAMRLVQAQLHPMPAQWSSEPGWTRYDPATGSPERVRNPDEDALVLDVETCVNEGQRPVLAVAVSPRAWYSWTSRRLVSSEEDYYSHLGNRQMTLEDLIPIEGEPVTPGGREGEPVTSGGGEVTPGGGGGRQRLVVGHHVSYDRARLREQYLIKVSTVFLINFHCGFIFILILRFEKMKFLLYCFNFT